MKRLFPVVCFILLFGISYSQNTAIDSLAFRVTEGTSKDRIDFKLVTDSSDNAKDWYRISSIDNKKLLIEGNNNVSLAVGLNHYLKYVAGIHISWNNLTEKLPEKIILPEAPIYRDTDLKYRYYLNYCTFSYSMPFWDYDRWMKEIDWMALHGVNMALSLTGIETVWKSLLEKFGYSLEEICEFIPGPAYMAWWQMNNLEGWGGPLPETRFQQQKDLQIKILERMRSLGISPILPGYSGLVPRNFGEKTGIKIKNTGKWCGFPRPGFLSPEDNSFNEVAAAYYKELNELYGKTDYYSMDPFHEGGDVGNTDLKKAGEGIYDAMKKNNADSKWVIQSWHENPRKKLIESVNPGDLIILDLYSEKNPKWEKDGGYGDHDWIFCMLLNFGGNVGLHGRYQNLINNFDKALSQNGNENLSGIGATPEGIENNPIMYELLFELPWTKEKIDGDKWLKNYLKARYGKNPDSKLLSAWHALINTVYNAPTDYPGEGTVESVICARPSWSPKSVSTWGNSTLFYSPDSTLKAKKLMEEVKEKYMGNKNNNNFLYDLIDISRQANADKANLLIQKMNILRTAEKKVSLLLLSEEFLNLILQQDSLLNILPDMQSKTWLAMANRTGGLNQEESRLYRNNAAMLITVWGDSVAANIGGLHDYSHREWGGIAKELYYQRWKAFFDHELRDGPQPDYYQMEKDWVRRKTENIND